MCFLWQGLSNVHINFERVTLTVTFDPLLNISHNFLTVKDWAFTFGIFVPYVHTFPMVPQILKHWTWLWTLTYFGKAQTLPPQTYTMPCGALPDFVSILVYFKKVQVLHGFGATNFWHSIIIAPPLNHLSYCADNNYQSLCLSVCLSVRLSIHTLL